MRHSKPLHRVPSGTLLLKQLPARQGYRLAAKFACDIGGPIELLPSLPPQISKVPLQISDVILDLHRKTRIPVPVLQRLVSERRGLTDFFVSP